MSVVDKALWVIERNSSGELNLPAVAEACGVSRSHLASAFGSCDRLAGHEVFAGASADAGRGDSRARRA